MPIFIDSRGSGEEELYRLLKAKHLAVERRYIESGDIVFGEVGIERKTVADLINSVVGGNRHFWDQLKVLKDTYEIPLVIVEGNIDYKDRLTSGILMSLIFGWRIPYLSTYNTYDTAELITKMFTKYGSNKSKGYPPAAVRKEMTPDKIKWAMLQCIRGVGPAMATKLIRKVGFHFIVGCNDPVALEDRLKKVKGLGKSRRDRIVKTFSV